MYPEYHFTFTSSQSRAFLLPSAEALSISPAGSVMINLLSEYTFRLDSFLNIRHTMAHQKAHTVFCLLGP